MIRSTQQLDDVCKPILSTFWELSDARQGTQLAVIKVEGSGERVEIPYVSRNSNIAEPEHTAQYQFPLPSELIFFPSRQRILGTTNARRFVGIFFCCTMANVQMLMIKYDDTSWKNNYRGARYTIEFLFLTFEHDVAWGLELLQQLGFLQRLSLGQCSGGDYRGIGFPGSANSSKRSHARLAIRQGRVYVCQKPFCESHMGWEVNLKCHHRDREAMSLGPSFRATVDRARSQIVVCDDIGCEYLLFLYFYSK